MSHAPTLIERVHASGARFVLATTGGGASALGRLLEVPGASRSVLEAVVPYCRAALEQWIGGPVDGACTEATARAMAMAAFQRCRALDGGDPGGCFGVGCTASLASDPPKRGDHRVHVALQSDTATRVVSVVLEKGARTRSEEERVAGGLVVAALAKAIGEPPAFGSLLGRRDRLTGRGAEAPAELASLVQGRGPALVWRAGGCSQADGGAPPRALFPGAFNPAHAGHLRMADVAEGRLAAPVALELSVTNVDKPPLDYLEIEDRLAGLAGRVVWLTRAPTFVEKARLAPGATFVVGADTAARIAEPRYYGGAPQRDAALEELGRLGARFLVFGRQVDGRFEGLDGLALPDALRRLCTGVPEAEFREDVSSTAIRSTQTG